MLSMSSRIFMSDSIFMLYTCIRLIPRHMNSCGLLPALWQQCWHYGFIYENCYYSSLWTQMIGRSWIHFLTPVFSFPHLSPSSTPLLYRHRTETLVHFLLLSRTHIHSYMHPSFWHCNYTLRLRLTHISPLTRLQPHLTYSTSTNV